MTALEGLRETALPGQTLFARGKVRDLYAVGDDRLLIVATDRISAFDAVLPTPIPDKGKVLNLLSAFWFRRTTETFPNHLLSTDPATYPPDLAAHAEALAGRSMLVRRTRRIDVECVARGYLAGSAWSEYRRDGTACGIPLPAGLRESEALPEPIFTPAIKAQSGHDENIPFGRLVQLVGEDLAGRLRRATLDVYATAARYAAQRGIIIADTKMEFGLLPQPDGAPNSALSGSETLLLIDELLTPDSSRFWEASTYEVGAAPPSYDKQYVRDYLEGSGWNKEPPAPALPPEVVAQTRQRYVDALRRLTGSDAL
ncbi:MAG TPA: phosphoribosylaminoimidazolesuccinocarboxamide synthase [Chloroflexota bacterium]|nr:phosphoribosylaminoimidazolesuccinocarboxamide synthase [Chloroflexota bacterium]